MKVSVYSWLLVISVSKISELLMLYLFQSHKLLILTPPLSIHPSSSKLTMFPSALPTPLKPTPSPLYFLSDFRMFLNFYPPNFISKQIYQI